MAENPVKVGVIGCGAISGAYFGGMKQFPILEVVACADLDVVTGYPAPPRYPVSAVRLEVAAPQDVGAFAVPPPVFGARFDDPLTLGWSRSDPVVQRRLIQNMRFLGDQADGEPDALLALADAALAAGGFMEAKTGADAAREVLEQVQADITAAIEARKAARR